ncbi:hypothetical protein BDR26DRAFT_852553 [Obelidium mucronatum]|nr:hypothetical protein BDR26DRAFT_852553 [Obelidium mucronatum]
MLTLRSKLIDACGLEDRLVLLDLIERFRHQNKDHVHYMYSICGKIGGGGGGCGGGSGGGDGGGAGAAIAVAIAPTVATEGISPSMPKEIPETAGRAYTRSVKRAIGLVPSLKGCRLVDQLCDLFEKQAQCEDPETRAAMIYKYIKARSDILDHCATIEVKNKVS